MSGHRRSLHSLIVSLVVLLGLALTAPAGIAAQDDDDADGAPDTIATQNDVTGQDDADDDTPGCDDNGWRIVTTGDGDGFRNEDHCDDHVTEHGEDSLLAVRAAEDNAYIYITVAPPIDGQCHINLTLVNGQNDVDAVITLSNGRMALAFFEPGAGKASFDSAMPRGQTIVSGTATSASDETPVPVLVPQPTCF